MSKAKKKRKAYNYDEFLKHFYPDNQKNALRNKNKYYRLGFNMASKSLNLQ